MITQHSGIMGVIAEAKARNKRVIVGGPAAFHTPGRYLDAGADVVVKGEAETVAEALVEAIGSSETGLVIEAPAMAHMPRSPGPRFDLLDLRAYADMAVQFSRGCPFQCEFCDITLMLGHEVRTKTPEQIISELQALYDLGWRRSIFFVDDNFIGRPVRAKQLLRAMIPWMEAHGHPFDLYTQASVNLAADEELMDLMVRAGFYRVFLGIETTDTESLELTKKFQNARVDFDQVCDRITRAGLQIIAGCIIGFDNERAGADERLIDLARRNDIPEMFGTLLQAPPGTALWDRLEQEGRLIETEFDDRFGSQTGALNFRPTRPSQEIVREFINLYNVLYEPSFYLERTFRNFSKMNRRPFRKDGDSPTVGEIRALAITFLRQGLLYRSRWKFWKYFFRALREFPDRAQNYVASCVAFEHYYEFRNTIRQGLEAGLAERTGAVDARSLGEGKAPDPVAGLRKPASVLKYPR
jgi:radical SAM superfamily enzyme YgiQ (UPF0313 family)